MSCQTSAPTPTLSSPDEERLAELLRASKHVTPSTVQKVRIRLIWHARGKGYCYPGNECLARACRLSVRTIKYAIRVMVLQGDISVHIWTDRRHRTITFLRPHPTRTGSGKPIFLGAEVPPECPRDAPEVPPRCPLIDLNSPELAGIDSKTTHTTPPHAETVCVDLGKPAEAETPPPTPKPRVVSKVVDLLIANEVAPGRAGRIAPRTTLEKVRLQADGMAWRLKKGIKIPNPGAYLATLVEDDAPLPRGFLAHQKAAETQATQEAAKQQQATQKASQDAVESKLDAWLRGEHGWPESRSVVPLAVAAFPVAEGLDRAGRRWAELVAVKKYARMQLGLPQS